MELILRWPRGADIAPRLMQERRAGKYLADIYTGGMHSAYGAVVWLKICSGSTFRTLSFSSQTFKFRQLHISRRTSVVMQ
jgi:hypothetical protein